MAQANEVTLNQRVQGSKSLCAHHSFRRARGWAFRCVAMRLYLFPRKAQIFPTAAVFSCALGRRYQTCEQSETKPRTRVALPSQVLTKTGSLLRDGGRRAAIRLAAAEQSNPFSGAFEKYVSRNAAFVTGEICAPCSRSPGANRHRTGPSK